ncbi:GNAT superfamily N-acetyltransferase [Rhizobium sp. BK316]|uniref:hypothetical protein n=1 Tax=Rhizobium sp. BK316 TaxID=2587053 RepID=UPI001617909B|nr:hypothetical protein [Rhizobium sp. BK316]MBB3409896.1 GNAT superfamily N-acetyltransferase [Rhizobium sp. BK316]
MMEETCNEITLISAEERPDLIPAFDELGAAVWPKFIGGDEVVVKYWNSLFSDGLRRHQFLALGRDNSGNERVFATSNSIPFFWPKHDDDASLPDAGWDAVLAGGVEAFASGRKPNALCALAIVVSPAMRGSDLAGRLIGNMKADARRHGLQALVAPVRPTKKAAYPLTSFADYIAWTAPSGAPFDPWVRKHWQLGASLVKIAPRSMRVEAPLSQWSEWSGLRFPMSGPYHMEGGLAPLTADCESGLGLYEEPNIWMRHRLEDGGR